ncbi:succinate dehydrogenase assembly factor 2 [Candidatus Coxiella mudrowiae]|uniref:FAD assembly factor SdhE n=1 Tax=Candidatus Coxiella mudrowiae TaxID=2054173 RepID=A0ABM5UUU1_9COXI|nr:succinate dehydrogenase assembly factor 2 [Candidatus Coxiella mudrowiae]AKQ33722.1 Tetratricopeptide repeat family protein [Candidatus Coxiella mudrowiae]
MDELLEARKIKWKCRRGMLELDILLERFYKNQFQILTAEEKKIFNRLLDEPDPLLYDWLLGHEIPSSPQFQSLVNKIVT